ncbi:MAG: enoyl-CoA hydratase/isomerase family protein [Acidimicrobiia bacterium]|nr:enoyl-CoA hydratase/isomerase family protein [Acidimicrobiia bacterium]
MPDYQTIRYEERDDGVAWVTLHRPEVHNAFDARMQTELRDCWRFLRRHDPVRCVVLTGAGDRAFCTGIDRTETMGEDRPAEGAVVGSGSTPFMFDDPGDNIGPKSCDLWKPVIAAVNGMACGGAFYMLGEVEFVIAAEHATFFDPHVTYGMTAAFEPIHMAGRMPFGEIMRLSLLGNHERLSAERAREIGLVSEVVPADELHDAAAWAAGAIASQPPLAVQGTLRAIWAARELSRRQAVDLAYAFVSMGTDQESIRQGQEAFASGKRVEWRLR